MKIPPNDIASFLKKPPAAIRGVLIYGPDSGLVSENMRLLSQAIVEDIHDPFRVAELSYDAVKESPPLFADELASLNLLGGRRLVRVRDAVVSLPPAIEKICAAPPGDSFFIITSGELPPTSSLRKSFEAASHLAALPCYKDEGAGIRSVIGGRFKAQGFSCDPQVLSQLEGLLAGDRLVILQEVDKLMLYMGDERHITAEDVEACMGEPLEVSLDMLCSDIASGRTALVQGQIEQLYRENIAAITIIRAVSRYVMRLHSVKAAIAGGVTTSQAIQALRPPVFFKQVPLFTAQVGKWPEAMLMQALASLAHLEAECKKTGMPAQLLCSRLMLLLAYRVEKGGMK